METAERETGIDWLYLVILWQNIEFICGRKAVIITRMSTVHSANRPLKRTLIAIARAGSSLLRAPALKADAEALLFSVKSFAAAMLAYGISLHIGLPKPYWAIVTVYIVSQNSAGASFSRGVYRFVGTVAGAVATVAIVPNFVNDPITCSVILACWIGLCLYFSLLDRTPRAYAFVLAGYTVSLIGFPSVLDPGAVFTTASMRVQEISVGILCAILMHRFVLPKRMTGQFIGKLSATLRHARTLAGDAVRGASERKTHRDRAQLAADLLALQGLATHLPYDPAHAAPRRKTLKLVHDRLAQLLRLTMEIEDRIHALGTGGHTALDELIALLGDSEAWIEAGAAERGGTASDLIERARSLQARIGVDGATPGDRLAANLAGHLAEMIGLLHDCDRLERNIGRADRLRAEAPYRGPAPAKGYVYHRDHWMAARAALGAIVGIVIGCVFWIWSAWPDGGMAVSILGVCCTLFGNVDSPAANVVKYAIGLVYGVAISLAYSFVILPSVTDFDVLVAVLAPAFLFAGSLQARPPTTLMALGITLTVPILAGLGTTYSGGFAEVLNSVIAVFVAIGFAIVSMTLFQTTPVDVAINRVSRLTRRDVRRLIHGGAPNKAHWTNLVVDRTALLLPRLALSKNFHAGALDDMLRHLRVGHAADRLRQEIHHVDGPIGNEARALLAAVAAQYGSGRRKGSVETAGWDQRIETLAALVTKSGIKDRSQWLDLLIDLRFALVPQGTVDRERTS